jgi:MoaA/NifB/PqqE/SkfB family radical SAM enzyme
MHDYGWDRVSSHDRGTILAGFAVGEALGGPYHLEIHPTDRCNAACTFCSTRRLRERAEMATSAIADVLDQAKCLGVRSVSLSGGGEPLARPGGRWALSRLVALGIPVAHVTTNGLELDSEIRELLVAGGCTQLRISLNAADRDDYRRMMGVGPEGFDRVIGNIRRLVAHRDGPRPHVIVQFLVDRHNFRSVPAMYRLGRALGVDRMVFNGLSYVADGDRMTAAEIGELVRLYRSVLERDEYRFILAIHNFEHDLSSALGGIERELGAERDARSRIGRMAELLNRRDQTLGQKLAHRRWMAVRAESRTLAREHGEPCLLPWYSMIVRADGTVPPCCVLQHRSVGSVAERRIEDLWHAPAMRGLRSRLRAAAVGDVASDDRRDPSDSVCAATGRAEFPCPFKATFYRHDLTFSRRLVGLVVQRHARPATGR